MTRFRQIGLAALLGIGVSMAAHAQAGPKMVVGDANQIADLMAEFGLKTERSLADDGTPLLESEIDGYTFQVHFYGCNSDHICDAIQFSSGFAEDHAVEYELMDRWNREYRFGRAYLDSEDDPWIEMDINLEGDGVSATNFKESLAYWQSILGTFTTHIGW